MNFLNFFGPVFALGDFLELTFFTFLCGASRNSGDAKFWENLPSFLSEGDMIPIPMTVKNEVFFVDTGFLNGIEWSLFSSHVEVQTLSVVNDGGP